MISFQDPPAPSPSTTDSVIQALQSLGWVDKTALAVLLVFFVLGLFKGLIWQVSRIGILICAYVVAGRFGHDVAGLLGAKPGSTTPAPGEALGAAEVPQGETTLYIAYCLLFVGVLIVLSLLAMLIKKLADRAGLGFFDRLGGGVLGVATGACVVLAGVFAIHMFFPSSQLAQAATDSHSLRWSREAISWLGKAVDDDLRSVLSLRPLEDPTQPGVAPEGPNGLPGQPGVGQPGVGQPGVGQPGGRGAQVPNPLPLPKGTTGAPAGGAPRPSPGAGERQPDPTSRGGGR